MSSEAEIRPIFLCTGSDRRQLYAARRLSDAGEVYTFCTDGSIDGVKNLQSLDDLPCAVNVLVLPMPCSSGLTIPSAGRRLVCSDFIGSLDKGAIITGGGMNTAMIEYFNSLGFDTCDYYRREELAVKNCVPTAEGTLALAMRELDVTVFGTEALIVGWGRVAKACARLFGAAGAHVTVAARGVGALAQAESAGFSVVALSTLKTQIGGFRLVINTVPAPVLTDEILCETRKDCLIIDLASKPGGTDFEACERYSRRAIHALSLPGKCAPVTAGEIIADAVLNIYQERSGKDAT